PNVIGKFRIGDIRHCYGDVSKIQSLGYSPQISLKEGLQDLVAWGREQETVSKVEDAHQKLVDKGLVV
ncbi:MAG: nucleoside-diphosphate sugar epimerase, partial [Nitrospinae bacterium]|nr:nucleoside-diphosphate sugar epimerase [Nitrospinota bacterium]